MNQKYKAKQTKRQVMKRIPNTIKNNIQNVIQHRNKYYKTLRDFKKFDSNNFQSPDLP